jgi:Flp pilus assembly protein TadG
MVVLLALIEFAFVFNAMLAVDFATRDGALAAAEAGSASDADCAILRAVDRSVTPPASNSRISEVRVFKADENGQPVGPANVYDRNGSLDCPLADGTAATLPYRLISETYPSKGRCNELAGCKVQTTVDTIGVQITYEYAWQTPLHSFLPMTGPGYTMVKSNAMRMEPVL